MSRGSILVAVLAVVAIASLLAFTSAAGIAHQTRPPMPVVVSLQQFLGLAEQLRVLSWKVR